jgi:hypothetical protein
MQEHKSRGPERRGDHFPTYQLVRRRRSWREGETERKREDLEREENKHSALCAFVPLAGQILG